ncbi:MAG TPA: glycosyltransferase family 2 protein [Phycisphaerae bacterium]|nr:glycosyltransferase family 2 protein [Phycisphaerae bacterium]
MTDTAANAPPADAPADLPAEIRRALFVVIPAYNESARVGDVIRDVRRLYPNVVAVDDGSRDDTAAQALRAGAAVLVHAVNRGQGAALQTGMTYALQHGAEYIVTFDSDGQHQVADIAALIEPIIQGRWDISLGSRFLGKVENITPGRKLLLRAGVVFTRVVSQVKITDTHNGLRAFSRRAAERIEITLDRMAHASEIIDEIRETQLPYGEVPVHIRYTDYSRAKGQSSLGAIKILIHYFLKRLTDA